VTTQLQLRRRIILQSVRKLSSQQNYSYLRYITTQNSNVPHQVTPNVGPKSMRGSSSVSITVSTKLKLPARGFRYHFVRINFRENCSHNSYVKLLQMLHQKKRIWRNVKHTYVIKCCNVYFTHSISYVINK
jgi:hypothetical protein